MGDMTDFRWDDLDQKLLSIRTQDLAEEMGGFAQREISEVQQKAVASNNSAYYVPAFCAAQLRVPDDWSKRLYEIYCDVWKKQGHSITAEFVRAVRDHAIETLFAVNLPPRSPNLNAYAERFVTDDQGIVPGADDLVRRECGAKSDC